MLELPPGYVLVRSGSPESKQYPIAKRPLHIAHFVDLGPICGKTMNIKPKVTTQAPGQKVCSKCLMTPLL